MNVSLRWLLGLFLLACAAITGQAQRDHIPRQYSVLGVDSLRSVASLPTATGEDLLDIEDPASTLSRILIPRAVGSSNLTKVHGIIRDHFKALSGQVETRNGQGLQTWDLFEDTFDADTPYGSKTFTNLIFTHDPTAPRKFILAAHTDSKFFPTAPDNGFVGATDSAVPCGLMLDVASTLNGLLNDLVKRWESESPPTDGVRTTLQMVFLDGEEAFKQWTHTDSIYGARCASPYLLKRSSD
jgi:hypothetical protein